MIVPAVSTEKDDGVPVPPDAVRVWRGYRLDAVPAAEFHRQLGATFIPVTVTLQRQFGLTAYLPTVMPAVHPDGVPDEIALVFYRSQTIYQATKDIPAGRAYQSLHATLFDLGRSHSGFPVPLDKTFAADTAYHLFPEAVDWQAGFTQVLVLGHRGDDPELVRVLGGACARLQANRPRGLAAAIVFATADWALYWEHWTDAEAAEASAIGALAGLGLPVLLAPFSPTEISAAIDAPSPGVPVAGGECFNTIFPRKAAP